jgi:exonuclease III
MRIVSWNCNMGFEKKRDVVMSLQPDILVLQECSAKDIAILIMPLFHNHSVGRVSYSLEIQANGFTGVTICRFF